MSLPPLVIREHFHEIGVPVDIMDTVCFRRFLLCSGYRSILTLEERLFDIQFAE